MLSISFVSSMLFAQDSRSIAKFPQFHYLTLSMGGGYAGLLSNTDYTADFIGGGGAHVGLGYEYCYRGFWLSLGIDGQYLSSRIDPMLAVDDVNAIDTEGDECVFHYYVNRWRDNTQAVYVNIPFMIGFNKGGFYAGIGAKAGLNVYAIGQNKLEYTTSATYDWAIGDFTQMPNHFIGDFVSTADENGGKYTSLKLKPNVAAIIELGYEVYNSVGSSGVLPWRVKVGLYGEYGLLNVNGSAQEGVAPYRHPDNVTQIITPSALSTEYFVGKSVHPLYVGAKVTFMFELPVPQKCNCLQEYRGASWRNNAPKVTRKQYKKSKRIREKETREQQQQQ